MGAFTGHSFRIGLATQGCASRAAGLAIPDSRALEVVGLPMIHSDIFHGSYSSDWVLDSTVGSPGEMLPLFVLFHVFVVTLLVRCCFLCLNCFIFFFIYFQKLLNMLFYLFKC